MIKFIEVNGVYEEGGKSFSFFDTVTDKFCEFSGSQIWDTEGEFRFDFKGENIDRYLKLIPDGWGEKKLIFDGIMSRFTDNFKSEGYYLKAISANIIQSLIKGVDPINIIEFLIVDNIRTEEINSKLIMLNSTPITWRQTAEKIEEINKKFENPE